MNQQQINLHQPIFRKQRALFSSAIVGDLCLVFAAALAVLYTVALWHDRQLARELAALSHRRDAATARMEELARAQAGDGKTQKLQAEVTRLAGEAARKEGVVAVLGRGDLGETTGFSAQLDALAERRVEGVWLTHIGLTNGGRDLSLRGSALSEELIPEFLERLSDEHGAMDGFTGTRFAEVKLKRSRDGSTIEFSFDTKAPEKRS